MNQDWHHIIPENHHSDAAAAFSATFGSALLTAIQPAARGASGALTYRVEANNHTYLLRIETRFHALRNPHQYQCMRIAAEAGIAPALHYVDEAKGVVLLDFIPAQPLNNFPGGPAAMAAALGELARRLQATSPFPVLADYMGLLEKLLTHLRSVASPGLLDPHQEVFERIRAAYPWDASQHVSSHNDPNPHNLLFDGKRLWLIDWETAFRNDPLTDVAVLAENHAATPELETTLLQAWLNYEPGAALRARLLLMRHLTRLYYAGMLCSLALRPPATLTSLAAPTRAEFGAMAARGEVKLGPETFLTLGKMCLASFVSGAESPEMKAALELAGKA